MIVLFANSEDNGEEFECFILHIELKLLSKGKYLQCFYDIFDSVVELLQSIDAMPVKQLNCVVLMWPTWQMSLINSMR